MTCAEKYTNGIPSENRPTANGTAHRSGSARQPPEQRQRDQAARQRKGTKANSLVPNSETTAFSISRKPSGSDLCVVEPGEQAAHRPVDDVPRERRLVDPERAVGEETANSRKPVPSVASSKEGDWELGDAATVDVDQEPETKTPGPGDPAFGSGECLRARWRVRVTSPTAPMIQESAQTGSQSRMRAGGLWDRHAQRPPSSDEKSVSPLLIDRVEWPPRCANWHPGEGETRDTCRLLGVPFVTLLGFWRTRT